MTSRQEINNLEAGDRRACTSANLSGYTILPKYRKSPRTSHATGQPHLHHHHHHNNNNIKYHQLPTDNKQAANKRRLPPKKTVLPVYHDHMTTRQLPPPSAGHKLVSPMPSTVVGIGSKNSNNSVTDGVVNDACHDGLVMKRSDGGMERRMRKVDDLVTSQPMTPRTDSGNTRRERDQPERQRNPNDVSFFLGEDEPASASSASLVFNQAKNQTWLTCQTPVESITLNMSDKPDDVAGPLHSQKPHQATSNNVVLTQPSSSSSPSNKQQLQRTSDSIKNDIKAKVDLRGKVKVDDDDHDDDDDDDDDGDDDYDEVRPSGVVIKKKYKTGLILGKYKNDSKNSISNLPGRKLRRQLTATNSASPKRRRDIFRSSSPELHCFHSDSTTGLVPRRSRTCGENKSGGGGGGCLASPRVMSSTTVDSCNDYTSVPLLIDPQPSSISTPKTAGSTIEIDEKSKCETRRQKCLSFWKSFMEFLFSTIGLFCCLIGYVCVGGLIFQQLESPNERRINREMKELRESKVRDLWSATKQMNVLHPDNWTKIAEEILENYTLHVFNSVKKQGWDGKDDEENQDLQWSFAGSLLYSITVITTIGYGHIAPKTDWGRIVTMLYAIIGIPLTLLTITNLGGFMATAFRFLYRNICCRLICVCCRKKARLQHTRKSANRQLVLMGKTVTATIIPPEKPKKDAANPWWGREGTTASEGGFNPSYQSPSTTSFLPLKPSPSSNGNPSWSNRDDAFPVDLACLQSQARRDEDNRRCKDKVSFWKRQKLKRSWTEFEKDKQKERTKPPVTYSQSFDGTKLRENSALVHNSKQPRAKKARKQEEQQFNIEVSESRRLPWRKRFEDIFSTDDIKQVKVPILVSLMLITGYIGLGALLFSFWEKDWSYLIGCYFCFVTLSTIGFGDYVPGTSADDWNNQAKLVLCAMYLFVGLALIAMCFDLMLEQVRCKFRQIGRCLGILDDGGKRRKLKMKKKKKKVAEE